MLNGYVICGKYNIADEPKYTCACKKDRPYYGGIHMNLGIVIYGLLSYISIKLHEVTQSLIDTGMQGLLISIKLNVNLCIL